MTRILVLSNMYPPHHYGGYELSCRDVVVRWRERGHRVAVLTTTLRVPGIPDVSPEAEPDIWRDLDFYFRDADLWCPPVRRRLAIERANQRALRRAIARLDPEVLSIWHMGAMSTGLLSTLVESGRPLVYSVCDDWLVYGPLVDPWMRLFDGQAWPARRRRGGPIDHTAGVGGRPARGMGRARLLGRRFGGRAGAALAPAVARAAGVPTALPDLGTSGTFCFVSQTTRRRAEEGSRWTYPDSTVVYSGIDRTDFPAVDPAGTARPWRWRLLYVGRVDDRKGIETAITSLSFLPEQATLDIVGRGHEGYRARLRALVAELGLEGRVREEALDRSELRDRYLAADAVVFPSEWEEPFGLVPVEAMSCGVPVVASGAGGSGEFLVDQANCLLFPVGDPAGLAAALRALAADPVLRRRLAHGGRRTADALDVDRLAEVLEAWHVGAAEGFARGRPPDRVLALLGRPRRATAGPGAARSGRPDLE
ncbi:MAG: glycosyltransferase [Acidimicrobiales bacterium]